MMSDAWAIDTQQLTKRYGPLDAVRSLDLKVARHGITGFLGRNGAGKSTTIKMLLGMTRPTSGSGTIVNRRIDHPRESLEARRRVAYVAEGKTIFFSSHQIAEVERIADRVCIIDHGQLVADLSLDDMRQEYRRITLGFTSEPPVADFQMPGVEHVRTSGRQMDVFVSCNAAAVVERARRAAVVSLDVTPLTLRDVFLETVQHSLRETA